jgi:hemerythrin
MKESNPIKRSKAFVPFSKDHHFGLLLAWKIRQDLQSKVEAEYISNYVLTFFDTDLQQHFKEEEELIFCKLSFEDALRRQAETEHQTIYHIIDSVREKKTDTALLNEFADFLESHIRFEERILFNYMQEKLTEQELDEVWSHIQQDNVSKQHKLFVRENAF